MFSSNSRSATLPSPSHSNHQGLHVRWVTDDVKDKCGKDLNTQVGDGQVMLAGRDMGGDEGVPAQHHHRRHPALCRLELEHRQGMLLYALGCSRIRTVPCRAQGWPRTTYEVPQQKNAVDCGMFTIK